MSPEEKKHFKEVYPRMEEGYALAQRLRDEQIRATVTTQAVAQLRRAFRMAAQLPPRPSSGLIDFYKALMKSR